MLGEYFQVRRLLWEDVSSSHVRSAAEEEELRRVVGSHVIDENQELRAELTALVEILAEYQQQSDGIRDGMVKRRAQRIPEPPGRALLVEKLRLLVEELHVPLSSPKEHELLQYVLMEKTERGRGRGDEGEEDMEEEKADLLPPRTPRMAELRPPPFSPRDGVVLRPSTSSSGGGGGRRPPTSSGSRPVSRGSTLSASSAAASSIIESPEVRRRLNVDEIDSIQEELQQALEEEKQQLLEDIEFIQSCIEMEEELLVDDRRQLDAVRPPPSFQELQELRRVIERTLEDQANVDRVEAIARKAEGRTATPVGGGSGLSTLLPRPLSRSREPEHADDDERRARRRSNKSTSPRGTKPAAGGGGGGGGHKVLKIRHAIQEARDEPFLT